ncbi:polysaccharide biosynthesis tyrosine autokinase [Bacteroides sp.]|uniref:GumC family protein n=1 Tax=Bacteroides sp. TaxID=29523 RepID=UPI0023BB7A42|nr:polysaccharide biosynthesis tyrosine autokinase [Bacteroides sp.]MDE6215491.1 polysaccharide biosynthesis tyrosine autokinase [Bacteroides sp.]
MQNNTLSNKNEQSINLVDLFVYLLSKWKWFLLSVLIFGGVAWYRYATSPLVFFRNVTVIIKDPSNKTSTAGLDRYDNYINKVNVANEILQFRSKRLMREVVQRLHADVDYRLEEGLRMNELYNLSPVNVSFINVLPERYISFVLTPKGDTTVTISEFKGMPAAKESYDVALNDTLTIGSERILLTPTEHWGKSWAGRDIHICKNPLNAVAGRFQGSMGIRQEEDESSILVLSLKDASPLRAEDVLNTLVNVYNEEALNDKNQVAVNTSEFINERLLIIERELGGVETKLESFKQSNLVMDISSLAGQYMGEARSYDADAMEQETQLKLAQFIKEYLTDPTKNRDLIPSGTGISDATVENQISQYNALKLKRDKLIDDSSESNPVVEELNNTIHALRQSIIRAVDNMIVGINMKRNDARSRQAQAQARFTTVPTKERQMLSIERQQKIKESLYMFLLNRREENALSQAMADNNARTIDSVDGPAGPISPVRNRILLLGVLVGLAVPGVVFLMILFMDTRVRSRKDLKGAVSIPFLGEIPQDKEAAKTSVAVGGEDDGMLSESFRILRTNMAFMAKKDKPMQVITFTSFNEGAGKTFISRNLAMSLVLTKKRVVLVDLDIRKGTLSRHFSKHPVGVTNYLADDSIALDDIIHTDEKSGNLDIISSGTVAPNPAELLMDSRLDTMMAELRKRYDYVIVDNVPIGIVADATISNRISDLTIFVVRAGKLDRRQLPDMEELYREGKLRNMALILNGVDPHRRGYGYGYGYGYGKHKKKK